MRVETTRDQRIVATSRLFLRPPEPEDLAIYRELYLDPEQTRFLPGGPFGAEAGARRAKVALTVFMRHWRERGFGPWAVLSADDRELIGHAGLRFLADCDLVELLFSVRRDLWRQGYATEAAQACLAWGFRHLAGRSRIIAGTHPEGLAAQRVLQKLGMRRQGTITVGQNRVVMFGIDRATYEQHRSLGGMDLAHAS